MCLFVVNDGSKIDPIKIFESIHSFDSNMLIVSVVYSDSEVCNFTQSMRVPTDITSFVFSYFENK